MGKFCAILITAVFVLLSSITPSYAINKVAQRTAGSKISHSTDTNRDVQTSYDPEMDCTKGINFSKAEKKQLDRIYWRIYYDYTQLIEAYAWNGGLTTEQKKFRYKMLRNYYRTFYTRNYRWCSEHEADEWEEEWYNSDNE